MSATSSARGRIAVLALALFMLLPSGAAAAASTNPSIDQYVETVPRSTGDGPSPGDPRSGGGGGGDLPTDVRRRIQDEGGSDAPKLEEIASSPALGAPDSGGRDGKRGRSGSGPRSGAGSKATAGASDPSTIEAVVTAGSHGDGSSYAWLLVGIVVLGGGMAGAALLRRRPWPRGR